jgi:hypothetical protein
MGSWAVAMGAVIVASIPISIMTACLLLSNSGRGCAAACGGLIGGLVAAASLGLLIWGCVSSRSACVASHDDEHPLLYFLVANPSLAGCAPTLTATCRSILAFSDDRFSTWRNSSDDDFAKICDPALYRTSTIILIVMWCFSGCGLCGMTRMRRGSK